MVMLFNIVYMYMVWKMIIRYFLLYYYKNFSRMVECGFVSIVFFGILGVDGKVFIGDLYRVG